jgi:succinate dehydrogenase / fumarate reductase cytochrome b subunit
MLGRSTAGGGGSEGEARQPEAESWGWVLQRFTGVLLLVFLGGHLWVEHFLHVGQLIRYRAVVVRLSRWLYAFLDFGLLAAVVYHGLNGLRRVLLERFPGARRWIGAALLALGLLTWAWGADILSAFLYHRAWLVL